MPWCLLSDPSVYAHEPSIVYYGMAALARPAFYLPVLSLPSCLHATFYVYVPSYYLHHSQHGMAHV